MSHFYLRNITDGSCWPATKLGYFSSQRKRLKVLVCCDQQMFRWIRSLNLVPTEFLAWIVSCWKDKKSINSSFSEYKRSCRMEQSETPVDHRFQEFHISNTMKFDDTFVISITSNSRRDPHHKFATSNRRQLRPERRANNQKAAFLH